MLDRGVEAADRWIRQREIYDGLEPLLEAVSDPAIVLLGSPGSGKSSLLRHHELELAIAGLRGEEVPISFYLPLNAFEKRIREDREDRGEESTETPLDWMSRKWAERYPALPPLPALLAQGRMCLLLDGLNEMPHAGPADYACRIDAWRNAIGTITAWPGNRIIFSCRSLDYSSPLSSETLPVPQAQLEAMSGETIREFLYAHVPAQAEHVWQQVEEEKAQLLGLFRTPLFLKLLVDQITSDETFPDGEAVLYTSFVRRALLREIKRGNPSFLPGTLLNERDRRGLLRPGSRRRPFALPRGGSLIQGLQDLATIMQSGIEQGEMCQVRISYEGACEALTNSDEILSAGVALGILQEDDEDESISFTHQKFQEYFAARQMAARPNFDCVSRPWRASEVPEDLATTIARLSPAETLPKLPSTGWEETTQMAAEMALDPDSFVRDLMVNNLALAGRSALRLDLAQPLSDHLRRALVERSRNPKADLRDRMDCGHLLGLLGDPRFECVDNAEGAYLSPSLIDLPAGSYPIGTDEAVYYLENEIQDHKPEHHIGLEAFQIGQFPVTNAEWTLFVQDGGYDDPRWWQTRFARAWRRGENTATPDKMLMRYWLRRFRIEPGLLNEYREVGAWPESLCDRMERCLRMAPAELEQFLADRYPNKRFVEPRFWQDSNFNQPNQPVVGVCIVEAQAYCAWLSQRSGLNFRLPTEIQLEAAARGLNGRSYPFGRYSVESEAQQFDRASYRSHDCHWRLSRIGYARGYLRLDGETYSI